MKISADQLIAFATLVEHGSVTGRRAGAERLSAGDIGSAAKTCNRSPGSRSTSAWDRLSS